MPALTAAVVRFDSTAFDRLPPSLRLVWLGLLAGAGTVASAAFACAAPFAAVAMLAAATLPLRRALAVTGALWLGNQIVGFALLDYPWDAETLAWGAIIGAASAAATTVAYHANKAMARVSSLLRLSVLFAVAFATYQVSLLLGSTLVAAHGGLAPDVMAYVAFIDAVWAIGLGAAYTGLQMLASAPSHSGAERRA